MQCGAAKISKEPDVSIRRLEKLTLEAFFFRFRLSERLVHGIAGRVVIGECGVHLGECQMWDFGVDLVRRVAKLIPADNATG